MLIANPLNQPHFLRPAPDQPLVLDPSNHLPTSTSRHRHHFAIAFQTVRNLVAQSINLQPSFMLYPCLMYAISSVAFRIDG